MSKPRPPKSVRIKQQFVAVAKLKLLVKHPELVEFHDSNSKEPELLLELKSLKNTVPIPQHWCQKKRYLNGRKEREPYRLPDFIEATGVSQLRQAYLEREEEMKLKQKMREKIRPKNVGCIDYQILYDAFFKNQKKGSMTVFGDIYYDGKDENQYYGTPFKLSSKLRSALGMLDNDTPPWAEAIRKYGPPPSYREIIPLLYQNKTQIQ
ncbi:hypothetical protein ENUP19_0083G0086 [Entamoeba nuttalli]|uniref:Splicing factor3B subunit 2, putative n=2 Tax=Entamoeba nuttalli TaxID=412467 RepID=K2GZA8_ENTNP|nr:splicing factor3B subunit 2, putative [Entamoeba nuttalli P19]EKE40553.1 splicing factor3B subunit 2, putative [Entamoeba nuttalli P19]|eukprot:XP_008857104.1 splicing factor3B subunit 2, putative [Entamoeba nuttalli P19]